MPKLAAQLTPYFTVYTYDRRGRGASGDTSPYAPDREVDDLVAVDVADLPRVERDELHAQILRAVRA